MNITNTIAKLPARGNIGTDKETVQNRFKETFSAAQKVEKMRIAKLADKAETSLYNIGKAGTIDARAALAIGYTLNISPFWFTGADEEKKEYSDDIAKEFVTANTPKSPKKAKRKYSRKTASDVTPETEREKPTELPETPETTVMTPVTTVEPDETYAHTDPINLSLDAAITLLSALHIRSDFDNSAKEKLHKIFAELINV